MTLALTRKQFIAGLLFSLVLFAPMPANAEDTTEPTPGSPEFICEILASIQLYGMGCGKVAIAEPTESYRSMGGPIAVLDILFGPSIHANKGRLLKIKGLERIYYLTASGYLRPVLSDGIFKSYGNKKGDILEIEQQKLNSYPRTEYIVLATDKNHEVYQIDGDTKRAVDNSTLAELGIKDEQIATVNQTEFDFYQK